MKNRVCNSSGRPQSLARRWRGVAVLAAMLVCLLLPGYPAFSQGRRGRAPPARQAQRLRARQRLRQEAARRPDFFERLRDLPPKEQDRVLLNDKRFQRLSPEARQKIRENLQHWNQLPPQQKEQLRKREQIFSQLSPDQRQNVREMSGQWRELQPAERRKVRKALQRMRGMSPEQRRKFLESPQFQKRFSPQEQDILQGLGRLFPGDGAPAP